MTTNTITTNNDLDMFGPVVASPSKTTKRDYTPTTTSIETLSKYNNKSDAIRTLSAEGKTRGEIADILNIRYQHVNNVLKQVLKRTK